MNDVLMTRKGLERLVHELATLRRDRQRLAARIADAVDLGGADPENGDWLETRREQELLDMRIGELEHRQRMATIVQAEADGEVDIGERVQVRNVSTGALMDFRLVGTGEDDPDVGCISHQSPVGAALLGRSAGELIDVQTPAGTVRFEILQVYG
jgi:transcription elongation factor GreA